MKKNFIKKIIVAILLICTMPVYSNAVPPVLKNIKVKQEFITIFDQMKNIRKNLFALNITNNMSKETAQSPEKDIKFYISELDTIQRNLESIKKQNIDSKPDVVFSNQLQFTAESIKISLEQILILIEAILEGNSESTELFYSDYLGHIYYYITLADQMIAYVDNYYNLK